MPNRSMQAKTLKLKKQRRLAPRKYSSDYIPCGAPPNRLVMSEYRMRTVSLAFDDKMLASIEANQRFHGVPAGKQDVRESLERLQAEGYHDKICFSILSNMYQRVLIFRNSDGTSWKILHEDFKNKFRRWSIEYASKERATTVWHTSKVAWIEKKPILNS